MKRVPLIALLIACNGSDVQLGTVTQGLSYADPDTISGDGSEEDPFAVRPVQQVSIGTKISSILSLSAGRTDDLDAGDLTGVAIETVYAASTVTGITPSGRGRGTLRFLELGGDGNSPLTIAHMSEFSDAANRIYCPDKHDIIVPPGGSVMLHELDDAGHSYRVIGVATTRWTTATMRHLQWSDLQIATLGSGSTDDWNLGASGNINNFSRYRVFVDISGSTLTGIGAPASPADGTQIILENLGDGDGHTSATLTLKEYDEDSSGEDRFLLPGLTDMTIRPGGAVTLIYDGISNVYKVGSAAP